MSHDHSHADARASGRRRLAAALALVVVYMAAEVVGGLLTNSLALLADAGHMLSDAASLSLALFALWIARKPTTPERTYGYHRTEILAALVNGVTLVVIAIFIVIEAWERFRNPPEVAGGLMMAIAAGGLLINLAGAWILWSQKNQSLNLRGAWLHILADALGSVQAIAAGALIWAFGWHLADPIASVLIALLVAGSSWSILRDSVHVLMEGTPSGLDTGEIQRAIESIDGVLGVHDLHIWTITSGFDALSSHVVCRVSPPEGILREIRQMLAERFHIEHSTIQIESSERCNDHHSTAPPCNG